MQLIDSSRHIRGDGVGVNCKNLRLRYRPDLQLLWSSLAPAKGPYFTPELLDEMDQCIEALSDAPVWSSQGELSPIKYVVLTSSYPGRFSLGGDLNFFRKCIESQDRVSLQHYGRKCVSVLFRWHRVLGARVTTIAFVQGKALGGGFECALSCHYILAEEGACFGFPEALFNLFPGMGGYSFLARRVGIHRAEDMIARGNQFSARVLKRYGVVKDITPPGAGEQAVEVFVREHRLREGTRRAIEQMRAYVMPVSQEELTSIVDMWVEFALGLDTRDLHRLDLLIRAQNAEFEKEEAPRVRIL